MPRRFTGITEIPAERNRAAGGVEGSSEIAGERELWILACAMEGKARTGEGESRPWGMQLLLAAGVLYARREEIRLVIRFRLRIKKRLYRVGCGYEYRFSMDNGFRFGSKWVKE